MSTIEVSIPYHYWLRHEVKPLERRTPLLPASAKTLIEAGHTVSVEHSPTRCIPDEEYSAVGCRIVETGSWPSAPDDAIILGLKELPEDTTPLRHHHLFFGHCYKNQGGWKELLSRFAEGRGVLWDLEFLEDENRRRVAAFGVSAGYVGMALGLQGWAQQRSATPCEPLRNLEPHSDFLALARHTREKLQAGQNPPGWPKVLVIGALGRCGGGALSCAREVGVPEENLTRWDMEETKGGGPFPQLLEQDIIINCIYLSSPIPPFITLDMLKDSADSRKLGVVVDVSCDTSNPNNPLPIYKENTTFLEPTIRVLNPVQEGVSQGVLDVVSIDHLPSLVPYSSSVEFATALFPHLLNFGRSDVWERAHALFLSKVQAAQAELAKVSNQD